MANALDTAPASAPTASPTASRARRAGEPAGSTVAADLRAGVIVFLVALPLCLGIATASGAPPLSGLIAGVVGGTVVALTSGSQLSVAGPAAGLTVIVLDAITKLGFASFLLATMLGGVLQMALGVLRLGRLGQLVPNAVIRGMLAAIGLILILKQLPHAVGHDADYEGDQSFAQPDGHNTFSELLYVFESFTPGAVIVSVCAATAMFLWRDYAKLPLRRYVPRELIAVVVGLACTLLFVGSSFELSPEHRVQIPLLNEVGGLSGLWVLPNFAAITQPAVWSTAFTLAAVASIESLLSVEATDRLDPMQRVTPPNRELIAQGAGNFVSGFLGGLPVTAVVVRSFTNVQAGGRTRLASVFHGVLLIGAILGLASMLNNIPLAALAVVLIAVGAKLTPPKLYAETRALGINQFVPFLVTVGFILFTDLLTGTLLGIGFAIAFTLWTHYNAAVVITDDGAHRLVRIVADVTFMHKAKIKEAVQTAKPGGVVVIDGTQARTLDADVLEVLRELEHGEKPNNITVSIRRSPMALHHHFREHTGKAA